MERNSHSKIFPELSLQTISIEEDQDKIKNRQQSYQSVYKKFKVFAIIGYLTGIFPVKNSLRAKSANELVYKKCSFIFIYSLLSWFIKITILLSCTVCFQKLYFKDFKSQTLVDKLALSAVYSLTFCFGISAHYLNVRQCSELIKLFQRLDIYDDKYPSTPTPIYSEKVGTCFSSNFLVMVSPLIMIINSQFRSNKSERNLHLDLGFTTTNNIYIIGAYSATGMFIIEFGGAFYYIVLYYIAALFTHRLQNIVQCVQDKSIKMLGHLDDQVFSNKKEKQKLKNSIGNWEFSCYRSKKSWSFISQQYLDFIEAFDKFCLFSGLPFILLFLSLILNLVCMVFFKVAGDFEGAFNKEIGGPLFGIVIIGFCRIVHLSDIGENLEKAHFQLLESLVRVSHSTQLSADERSQFKQLKTLVRMIPITVNAKGYFTINRKNVTSILSVIITYIIVLVQFRMSLTTPPAQSSSGNSTASCNCTEWMSQQ